MNTQQLEQVINRDAITRAKFGGVFAENSLPKHIETFPCGFIANTEPESKPGQHWIAFYFSSPQQGEFFDSYGHEPVFYSKRFKRFLDQNAETWISNKKELQSYFTAVCGEYCIFYLLHRARGVPMDTIVNLFSSDKDYNDHLVYQYVKKLF